MKVGQIKQVSLFLVLTYRAASVLLQVGAAGLAVQLDAGPPVPVPTGLRLPPGNFLPGLSLGGRSI